jgi:hypothetical protein
MVEECEAKCNGERFQALELDINIFLSANLTNFMHNIHNCYVSLETECPNGKEYQECGTSCPVTCKNKDETRICTFECVQGKPHILKHNVILASPFMKLVIVYYYCTISFTCSSEVFMHDDNNNIIQKGLWCSSTVWLLSTQTRMNECEGLHPY